MGWSGTHKLPWLLWVLLSKILFSDPLLSQKCLQRKYNYMVPNTKSTWKVTARLKFWAGLPSLWKCTQCRCSFEHKDTVVRSQAEATDELPWAGHPGSKNCKALVPTLWKLWTPKGLHPMTRYLSLGRRTLHSSPSQCCHLVLELWRRCLHAGPECRPVSASD